MAILLSASNPYPLPFEAVIFDLDGTLVDSSLDLTDAVNHALMAHDLPPRSHAEILTAIGDGARTLIERALPAGHEAYLATVFASFNRYYDAHLLDKTRPYPGVGSLLQALRVPRVVVSNKPERYCRRILEGLGLVHHFRGIWGGDSLTVRKPAPESLLTPLASLGLAAGRALMVGDGAQDVRAAQAADIACCGALWGFRGRDELEALGVPYLVASPIDLLAALGAAS